MIKYVSAAVGGGGAAAAVGVVDEEEGWRTGALSRDAAFFLGAAMTAWIYFPPVTGAFCC